MAKNPEKYTYVQVSLLKTSALHTAILAEAQGSGADLTHIILLRLAERYGLASSTSAAPSLPAVALQETGPDMSQADQNAAAAASYWE